jgi:hypothetical protein
MKQRGPRLAAAAISAFSGAWWLRHVSARAVRSWNAGAGRFVRTGRLVVRVAGSRHPIYLLLHALVASGETFGSANDWLADSGTSLVRPQRQAE